MNAVVVVSILLFIVGREIMFHMTLQKLVNKLMAGSYQGYVAAERTIGKSKPEREKVEMPENNEDLSYLNLG